MSDDPARDARTTAASDVPADAVRVETRTPTPLYRWLSAVLLRLETWVRSHGSARIRWATRAGWALVAGIGILLLVGPVINKPIGFEEITASTHDVAATWIARSFTADYTLRPTADGRLDIDITERITAFFPDGVDEDAVERVIPSEYESHDLAPKLTGAVLDGAKARVAVVPSATRVTFRVLGGQRLRGDHDIVLRYTLHDLAYRALNDSTGRWEQLVEWNAFGPQFPHGVAHSELRITVPRTLVDEYARQPRGGVSWLIVGDSAQLDPDRATADAVTYSITNDQNLPPYATLWFRLPFQPDTFVMPAPSLLYWVQAIGPFLPLALLAVTLLFALAARAVAWSDARGRAWYVYQEAPQKSVSATLAARLWRAVSTSGLVAAVAAYQADPSSGPARNRLVRAASRTGRVGNLLLAWTGYLGAPAWREQFSRNLRRVPRGFVRDSFIGAALAWTVLQWGLVRQLSYQVPLSVYWWPVAIVAATMVLAVVILVLALSARPLTRQGAFAKEHLMGLRLFVQRTRADERTSLKDPLLPYAVMFSSPRRARRLVRGLLAREGVRAAAVSDPAFVTGPRLAVRASAALAVLAAVAAVIWVPVGGTSLDDDAIYHGDLPGDYGVFVTDFSADAALVPAGRALRLDVVETMTATVGDGYRDVPQVLREWRDEVYGHRSELTVTAVTVDGEEVPFTQSRMQHQSVLQTRMADEWPGEHTVVVRYRIENPIARVYADGAWRQQLRWSALNPGWEFGWSGTDSEPRRVAVSLTVPDAVRAQTSGQTGWLGGGRWPDTGVRDWGAAERASGGIRFHEEFTPDEDDLWPMIETGSGRFWASEDVNGAQLQFAENAFEAGSRWEFIAAAGVNTLPFVLPLLFAGIAIGAAVFGMLRQRRGPLRGIARDVARWVPVGFGAGQLVLFGWATKDMAGDEPGFLPLAGAAVLTIASVVAVLIVTRSGKRDGARSRRTSD